MKIKLKASGRKSPGVFPGGFMPEASFLDYYLIIVLKSALTRKDIRHFLMK